MIPVDSTQKIEVSGAAKSIGSVTTNVKNLPFLVLALSDRIYKDKILAVIREYSTNAWDAHVLAKEPVANIVITLPTLENPTLRIRDFGFGLSMEEVRDVYCIIGESTKRGSNDFNGQLGMGCKAGFAYGDSFLVTSCNNGKKSVYNLIKGDAEKTGDVLRLSEIEMGSDDRSGIEVAIPVKPHDLHSFHQTAYEFYRHWEVLPVIHGMDAECKSKMDRWRSASSVLSGEGWEVRTKTEYNSLGVACMGQVAYPIDWRMLYSKLALTPMKRSLLGILQSNDVVLRFPIGSLKFTINREELEYTDTTFKALEDRFETIFSTIIDAVIAKFAGAKSIWEAKRLHLSLFGKNIGDKEEGTEVESLKILDGEFFRLEDHFKGKLLWNGVAIDSPHFSKINRFDISLNNSSSTFNDHDPITPCMVSFRKHKSRVKKLRCTASEHNRITPYNGVVVVINDTDNLSATQSVARYYLLGDCQRTSKVHILRFGNHAQRDDFFREYSFDTASYVLLSSIIDDVKAWQKLSRRSYSSGSDRVQKVRFYDIAEGFIKEEEMSLRDLESGGIYAGFHRGDIELASGYVTDSDTVMRHAINLFNQVDLDVDRVYLIPRTQREAKWFKKANDEGQWIELSNYIKENVEVIVTEEMRRAFHWHEWRNNGIVEVLELDWANALRNKLNGEGELFDDYLYDAPANPSSYYELNQAVRFFDLPKLDWGQKFIDRKQALTSIQKAYPLLAHVNIYGESLDRNKLPAIVDYIRGVTVLQKEEAKKDLTSDAVCV